MTADEIRRFRAFRVLVECEFRLNRMRPGFASNDRGGHSLDNDEVGVKAFPPGCPSNKKAMQKDEVDSIDLTHLVIRHTITTAMSSPKMQNHGF